MIVIAAVLLAPVLLSGARLSADQLVLKSGEKLTGAIVGFEHGMFRLKTEFGFELVRRDKVATITISGEKQPKAEAAEAASSAPAAPSGSEKPAVAASPIAKSSEAAAAAPAARPQPPVPGPPHPLDEPLPKEIRQHIDGPSYVNETFRFSMFKPLEWKLLEDIRQETATGIVAMGSDDEQTLVIVDRQLWSGQPNLERDRIVLKIRNTYSEYRKLSEERVTIDGLPAVRSSFSGVADGAEWHGVSVHMERGDTVFGIIGLTSAESYQFQEAVFDKIIRSFHFLDQRE